MDGWMAELSLPPQSMPGLLVNLPSLLLHLQTPRGFLALGQDMPGLTPYNPRTHKESFSYTLINSLPQRFGVWFVLLEYYQPPCIFLCPLRNIFCISQNDLFKWKSPSLIQKSPVIFNMLRMKSKVLRALLTTPGHLSSLISYLSSSLVLPGLPKCSPTSEPSHGLFPQPGMPFPEPSHCPLPLHWVPPSVSSMESSFGQQLAVSILISFHNLVGKLCASTLPHPLHCLGTETR